MRWQHFKIDSKRRWVARFRLGQLIPHTALVQHPDLIYRLFPRTYVANIDCFRLTRLGERADWTAQGAPIGKLQ